MKVLAYFPLVYLADVHGFILMVPYLIFCLMLMRYVQIRRTARASQLAPRIIEPQMNTDEHR